MGARRATRIFQTVHGVARAWASSELSARFRAARIVQAPRRGQCPVRHAGAARVWRHCGSAARAAELLGAILRALDRELDKMGVSRGRGKGGEYTAQIVCPPADAATLKSRYGPPWVKKK